MKGILRFFYATSKLVHPYPVGNDVVSCMQVYYLPESGASMLLGLFIGGMFTLFDSQDSEGISFKPEIFFYGLLPPIIFEAGFSLHRVRVFVISGLRLFLSRQSIQR